MKIIKQGRENNGVGYIGSETRLVIGKSNKINKKEKLRKQKAEGKGEWTKTSRVINIACSPSLINSLEIYIAF
jgi:hypothetical protein